jgi:hypothetical protein
LYFFLTFPLFSPYLGVKGELINRLLAYDEKNSSKENQISLESITFESVVDKMLEGIEKDEIFSPERTPLGSRQSLGQVVVGNQLFFE